MNKNLEDTLYKQARGFILKWIGLGVGGIKGFAIKYLYDFLFEKTIYRAWVAISEYFEVRNAKKKREKTFDKLKDEKTQDEFRDNFNDILNGK